MDTVRALRQVIMFKEVPEPVLKIVAGTAEEVSVPAGEEIISVRDRPDALFVIRNGTRRLRSPLGGAEGAPEPSGTVADDEQRIGPVPHRDEVHRCPHRAP